MHRLLIFAVAMLLAQSARADLTLIQKIEGADSSAGKADQITIKMKGDKSRIETGQRISVIIDGRTGEMLTLIHDQKKIVRISGDRAKAMVEMAKRFQGSGSEQKAQLVDTGKKETLNGVETEIYTSDIPQGKATYWVAPNYPNGAAILKQMQAIQPGQWSMAQNGMPDLRDFPGLPVKTMMSFGGKQITTTLESAKEDPLPDSEFTAPADYQEMKMPNILSGGKPAPSSASPSVAPGTTP